MKEFDNQGREFVFTIKDFNFLRDVAVKRTGIVLKEDKFNMMYSRLARRIRVLGLKSFSEYCTYLSKHEETETVELVNAITTNLTSFFRELHHFEYLSKEFIPYLVKTRVRDKKIRIWSAGCSTGEEPYSLAITLKEAMQSFPGWDVKILATDIDSSVLSRANEGIYDSQKVNGLDKTKINKWFDKTSDGGVVKYAVVSEIKNMIQFKQLNLMNDWPFNGLFDVIFCRNVIIYFDKETKKNLVERFAKYMHTDGRLFLGHSESLFRVTERFDLLGKTIYSLVNE